MIPEHAPKEIVTFCEEKGIEHIHIDTDEYDIDCIPNKEEKKRVLREAIERAEAKDLESKSAEELKKMLEELG